MNGARTGFGTLGVVVSLVACGAGKGTGPAAPASASTEGAPSVEGESPPRSDTVGAPSDSSPTPTGACTGGPLKVTRSELSPRDRCDATFYCPGARTILVTCDGENDGTGTSLCDCEENGRRASVGGAVPGEAPDSCLAAANPCLAALGAPPR
jgi:hypothetical protein